MYLNGHYFVSIHKMYKNVFVHILRFVYVFVISRNVLLGIQRNDQTGLKRGSIKASVYVKVSFQRRGVK